MSQANPFMAALSQHEAQAKQTAEKDAMRREYIGILRDADPAKVGRLRELADGLGLSMDAVKADAVLVQQQVALPATPARDPYANLTTGVAAFARGLKLPGDVDGSQSAQPAFNARDLSPGQEEFARSLKLPT